MTVVIKLENDISRVIKWFNFNSMVVNPAKFQLMFLGQERKPRSKYCIDIDGNIIPEQNEIKLLGVTIDQKLNFDSHLKSFCKKANQKVRAWRRIRTFINFKSAKLIYNAYILSAFSYCPLIWTFCGKSANGLINNTHLRALKMIYKSENLSLEDILHKDLSVKIHTKNMQLLMLEVYKSRNKLNTEFKWDLFRVKESPYSLRAGEVLIIPPIQSTKYGINSLIFKGSMLWNTVPNNIKQSKSIICFKKNIKSWLGDLCGCSICRN